MTLPVISGAYAKNAATYVASLTSAGLVMPVQSGRWILVGVLVGGGGSGVSPDTATIGGVALSAGVDASLFDYLGTPGRMRWFYLQSDSIPTGAQDLVVTVVGGTVYFKTVAIWGHSATAISAESVLQGGLHAGVDPRAVTFTRSSDANSLAIAQFFMYTSGDPLVYIPSLVANGGTTQELWDPLVGSLPHGLVWSEPGAASVSLTGTVSGSQFSPTSVGRTFSITGSVPTGPTIGTQPTDQTANEGSTATFGVSATSSGGALVYQWKRKPTLGGVYANVGASASTYETPVLTLADSGAYYQVRVSDDYGFVDSAEVSLTVADINQSPTFIGPAISIPSGVAGAPITPISVAARFQDLDAGDTFTFTKGGVWPGSVTLVAGVISGVYPAVGTTSGLSVVGTSNGGLFVASNTFSITSTVDSVAPTLTGEIVVRNLTPTGYDFDWPVATDDLSLAGYDYSLNGGVNWTSVGVLNTASASSRAPGSVDSVRVRARDAAGNLSTPVLQTEVALPSLPDVTAPTLTGTIELGAVGNGSYAVTCPVGADNVAVVGYDVQINEGSWTPIPYGGRTANISGRPPGVDTVAFRARDAAGNTSAPLSRAVAVPTAVTYGFVSDPLYYTTGSPVPQANKAVDYTLFIGGTTGSLNPAFMYQGSGVTDGLGRLSVSGLSYSGTGELWMRDADGGRYFQQIVVL